MLADRGHLRYDQRIAELWPDFAQNGKEGITVADLMRHEAGLAEFDFAIPLDNTTTQALKAGKLSSSIASQTPKWRSNSRRQYHSLTRGLIANEIVMRADPQQRTIGEFVAQEIAGPLRCALTTLYRSHTIVCTCQMMFCRVDCFVGLPKEELQRTVPLTGSPLCLWAVFQSLLPCGRLVDVPNFLITFPVYAIMRCVSFFGYVREYCSPGSTIGMIPFLGSVVRTKKFEIYVHLLAHDCALTGKPIESL